MKKLILLLALALGVEVKGQIVGGFMPMNSSKTPTMGGLRVNGALTATGTITGGSLKTGSTTIIGGASNATLTGGNTGTVAVLSDAVFAITFQHGSYNPSDGLTVYYGNNGGATPITNSSFGRVYAQNNLTLIGYDHNISVLGSAGSAESGTVSVRVDNTTNIVLNSSVTYSAASGFTEYHSSALNSDINSGSYFNIQWVSPTWVTNPTSVIQSVTLWFRRRL